MKIIIKSLLLVIVAVVILVGRSSYAQQSLQIQGLGINPFLIELDMEAGQTLTQEILLTNTTSTPLTFNASINDFVPNGSSGQPIFLPSDQTSDSKFALSNWITVVQQPQFTIAPYKATAVRFKITVPQNAEPGTHYGAILFGQSVIQNNGVGSAVQHKAGTIILVRLGKSQEQVEGVFSTLQTIYQHGPIEFNTTLRNIGNVHAKPKGDITVRNIWGVNVAQIPVNPDALVVLPQSTRDFSSRWGNRLGFGRYTAEAVVYYGNPKLELRLKTVFWIIPVKQITLGVLVMLILAIILYISIRRYNRYIINRFLGNSDHEN